MTILLLVRGVDIRLLLLRVNAKVQNENFFFVKFAKQLRCSIAHVVCDIFCKCKALKSIITKTRFL